jgi:hypothetical protein
MVGLLFIKGIVVGGFGCLCVYKFFLQKYCLEFGSLAAEMGSFCFWTSEDFIYIDAWRSESIYIHKWDHIVGAN